MGVVVLKRYGCGLTRCAGAHRTHDRISSMLGGTMRCPDVRVRELREVVTKVGQRWR